MSSDLTLTLLRGLPGSGKSTLAHKLNAVHIEADMYFLNAKGVYTFQPSLYPLPFKMQSSASCEVSRF